MKIGIFGGSFDPIHYGHLLLAELCREQCELDEVRFVPASVPPHKQEQGRAAGEHRIRMIDLAIGGHATMTPWDIELQRGGVSYTVETLETLRTEHPNDELCLLMGADSLYDLPNWRNPKLICQWATLVVVDRPGSQKINFEVLTALTSTKRIQHFNENVVTMPQLDISSSEIRSRIQRRKSIRFQTPRAVEEYIHEQKLYLQPSS